MTAEPDGNEDWFREDLALFLERERAIAYYERYEAPSSDDDQERNLSP